MHDVSHVGLSVRLALNGFEFLPSEDGPLRAALGGAALRDDVLHTRGGVNLAAGLPVGRQRRGEFALVASAFVKAQETIETN